MSKYFDLGVREGAVFGRLTVRSWEFAATGHLLCHAVCICGQVHETRADALVYGKTQSCGCLQREIAAQQKLSHGKAFSSVYEAWHHMVQRCTNPSDAEWHNYGGRGITVNSSWLQFAQFYADMGDPPEGLTLDRERNSEGYCKSNCRWVSVAVQSRNRRGVKLSIEIARAIRADSRPHSQIASTYGIDKARVSRIRSGKMWREINEEIEVFRKPQ